MSQSSPSQVEFNPDLVEDWEQPGKPDYADALVCLLPESVRVIWQRRWNCWVIYGYPPDIPTRASKRVPIITMIDNSAPVEAWQEKLFYVVSRTAV